MTEPATIRLATAADAASLARLCEAHARYERIPYQAEGHAQRLATALQQARLHAWLAEQSGEVLGYASTTLDYATLAGLAYLHLDCLYLRPDARGQGLGAALLATVCQHGRSLGCKELQWQTPDWNQGAIRFYRRLGAQQRSKVRFSLGL
ncbi:N-acetyltransferase [Chitinimonas prasina]|uniref:N-acetyltransferase n=1 Tax=Chitinimonas prasina TaxID=1434937 RepID=A0ABQ5YBB4_9NEIS|nr:GNAT family N-acetyltransferase [Chitinimonas prasina]GLR12242.1 N-acetyltransferase [Chitinimonas prasina]